MATAVKRKLSGSTDGRGKKITTTATPGDTIHTATPLTADGSYDEIWLWAFNSDTVDVLITIEFGGTTAPDDNIVLQVPSRNGLFAIVPGLILQNTTVVKIFAGTANKVVIFGFVNRMTD